LGRYSFIGTAPYLVVQTQDSVGTIHHNQEISKVDLGMSQKYRDPYPLSNL